MNNQKTDNDKFKKLFPIFLVEHKNEWMEDYLQIEKDIKGILKGFSIVRISHIGSTAIRNIYAKNIVDILLEIQNGSNMDEVVDIIEQNNFEKMSVEKNRISFRQGYRNNGFDKKVFHLHLRFNGDNDELYFRDYLNDYPEIAKEYEKLKLNLWKKYEFDRISYTNGKTEFIRKYTKKAKELYKGRY